MAFLKIQPRNGSTILKNKLQQEEERRTDGLRVRQWDRDGGILVTCRPFTSASLLLHLKKPASIVCWLVA